MSGLAGDSAMFASGARPGQGDAGLPVFEGIIFDMDGLLVDTEPTYAHAWRSAALSLGVALDTKFLHSLFGRHAEEVERCLEIEMGEAFSRERFFAEATRVWHEYVEQRGIPLMPGVEALLDALKQSAVPYALATNSDSPFAWLCLERAGLAEDFPVIVCRDEVPAGKPEPDLFIEAARRLGVAIERCLALEDSPTGLLGASRAGAIPILVSVQPVSEATRELAYAVFTSLGQLTDRLRTGGALQ